MRPIYAITMFLVCFSAPAAELLCEGSYLTTAVGPVTASVPIRLEEKTLGVTIATLSGDAIGTVKDSGSRYNGYVYGRKGQKYWLDLDRYTGSVTTSYDKVGGGATVEFSGNCRPAKKLF